MASSIRIQNKSVYVVMVTAPTLAVARALAAAALEAKVVACAQLLRGLESRYWWKGRLETSREVLILFKTTAGKARALEKVILDSHPYETPEILFLPVCGGNLGYLNWVGESLRPAPATQGAGRKL